MILTLAILAITFLIAAWLTFMYLWYRKEQYGTVPFGFEAFTRYFEKSERMVRRGWYATGMYTNHALVWGNKEFSKVFFKFFPKARRAFAPKDALTGLDHGPSSYFLMSISEPKKEEKKVHKKVADIQSTTMPE